MKFSGKVGNGPALNFGGDPDTDPDPYRDTGKTYLGGGMHCPSASSYFIEYRHMMGLLDNGLGLYTRKPHTADITQLLLAFVAL